MYFSIAIYVYSFLFAFSYLIYLSIFWQYYIFAYVDAPGYQILENLNIINTGIIYGIILKKRQIFWLKVFGCPFIVETIGETSMKYHVVYLLSHFYALTMKALSSVWVL